MYCRKIKWLFKNCVRRHCLPAGIFAIPRLLSSGIVLNTVIHPLENLENPQVTTKIAPTKSLSLFDSTCLIVGIIIGAGLYQMAPDIAKGFNHVWAVLAIWALGGALSLCGAMSYAELATTYPREGGDYVYLNRAYGRWAGFLFGWVQLVIVRPGDIAVMAFAFATYAQTIFNPFQDTDSPYARILYASGATLIFTIINIVGVREGKWAQNLLTTAKVLGLLMIIGVAFIWPGSSEAAPAAPTHTNLPVSVALILVLFTFGGWNEMVYVAAEVKDPNRNIVRALVLGAVSVTILYLLANGAFLYALGHAGMANSEAVATDTVSTVFPATGGRVISALVCISALGAVNGLIFTGARISYALGSEHRIFNYLGHWNSKTGTPIWALIIQAAITIILILVLGSFMRTVLYTASAVYSFYFASSMAVIVLRRRDPGIERPYRVFGYPFVPLVFAGTCAFLIYSALNYDPQAAVICCLILLAGLPVYWITQRIWPSPPAA